jgi:hypothetical protein
MKSLSRSRLIPRELPRISKEEEVAFEKNKVKRSEDEDDSKPNESSSAPLFSLSNAATSNSFLVVFFKIQVLKK